MAWWHSGSELPVSPKCDMSRGFDLWFRVGYEDPMQEKKQAESHHTKNRHHVEPTGVGLLCQACRRPLSD